MDCQRIVTVLADARRRGQEPMTCKQIATAMPVDFPPWDRVYVFFRRWRDRGWIIELHDRLRAQVREDGGRDPEPTAAIIDSQTIRSTPAVPVASSGCDGNNKTVGRKRHLLTDTIGLLPAVAVTPADIGDRDAGQTLLQRAAARHHRIRLVRADGGYTGFLVSWVRGPDSARSWRSSSAATTPRASGSRRAAG